MKDLNKQRNYFTVALSRKQRMIFGIPSQVSFGVTREGASGGAPRCLMLVPT